MNFIITGTQSLTVQNAREAALRLAAALSDQTLVVVPDALRGTQQLVAIVGDQTAMTGVLEAYLASPIAGRVIVADPASGREIIGAQRTH